MTKLADVVDLKSIDRNIVRVQIPFPTPKLKAEYRSDKKFEVLCSYGIGIRTTGSVSKRDTAICVADLHFGV